MTIESMPILLTSDEVAKLLGLSLKKVQQKARKGEIKAYRLGKSTKTRLRFFRGDVVDYVNNFFI